MASIILEALLCTSATRCVLSWQDCCCFEVTSEIAKCVITSGGIHNSHGSLESGIPTKKAGVVQSKGYQFEESTADSINAPDGHG